LDIHEDILHKICCVHFDSQLLCFLFPHSILFKVSSCLLFSSSHFILVFCLVFCIVGVLYEQVARVGRRRFFFPYSSHLRRSDSYCSKGCSSMTSFTLAFSTALLCSVNVVEDVALLLDRPSEVVPNSTFSLFSRDSLCDLLPEGSKYTEDRKSW
jgi:hypothetical protein